MANPDPHDDVVKIMKALAHPKRVTILDLANDFTPIDIANRLCITRAGLQKHLAILQEARLIERRHRARGGYQLTQMGTLMKRGMARLRGIMQMQDDLEPSPHGGYGSPSFQKRTIRAEEIWT